MTEPFAIGSNRVFLPRPGVAEREAVCLTPYAAYVLKQWQDGHRNGLRLFEERQARGYRGSPRTLYRFLAALKSRRLGPGDVPDWPLQDFTAHEAVWLDVA